MKGQCWRMDTNSRGFKMTSSLAKGVLITAVLAWFFASDPLELSSLSGIDDFHAQYVAPPPFNVLANIKRDTESKLQASEIIGTGDIFGPESIAFDVHGKGPYTGLSDGRIVRYDGPELGWTTFATTSTKRSAICDYNHTPEPQLDHEHICGRPLGLRFEKRTGELYIADPYFGILKVGREGGLAEPVVTGLHGDPFKFCNDLDFDEDGNLYFTVSSTKYQRRQFFLSRLELENTGRFLMYNPTNKETTVLIQGLRFPNGVAVSKDGTFVVIAESNMARLLRYWLKGPKANTWEVWVDLPGVPDNVRRNENGDFWVAFHGKRTLIEMYTGAVPWLRHIVAKLPIPSEQVYAMVAPKPHALIVRYSSEGQLLEVLEDQPGKVVKVVSEVEEHDGKLYMGSVLYPQIAVYSLPSRV
jgi:sugar lactone lactonase YvrE